MTKIKDEKVKLYDGTEADIEIHLISGPQRDHMLDEFIRTKIKAKNKEREADVDYKPYTLRSEIMKKFVKGVDVEKIDIDEYDRIFSENFVKYFPDVFGGDEEDTKN